MPILAVLLIFYVRFVHSLQFAIPSTLEQCSNLAVSWNDGAVMNSGGDFNLTFLPFDSIPFNVTVPASAWTTDSAGSFSTTFPIVAGTSFIIAAGSGPSAATSNIVTVTSSNNTSCLIPATPSKFVFATNPINCQPTSLNISYFAANRSDAPILRGFVPAGGPAFEIAPVGMPPSWFVTVDQETQMVLEFSGPDSSFGTSKLLTVGGPLASKCGSALFFSGKAKNNATSAAVSNNPPDNANRAAKLIGIIAGTILGVLILVWVLYIVRERYIVRPKATGGDDEWGFVMKNDGTGKPGFTREKSSKLFYYGQSGLNSQNNASSDWRQKRPAMLTAQSASGRMAPVSPRLRTPGQEDNSFDSLNPALLPQLQLSRTRSEHRPNRPQRPESGRVI